MTDVGERAVRIVVPVYGGLAETLACFESIERHTVSTDRRPVEVVVVDDASPDAALRDACTAWTATPRSTLPVSLRRRAENGGFVAAVNDGIDGAAGDVVLLNADTVVTAGWLDRLCDAAASRPDVATVTPLTNEGSIVTVPDEVIAAFGLSGPDPAIDACAAFVADQWIGTRAELITGVGFCLLITQAALDLVGVMDTHFSPGYGEEVDFCLRASANGLVHLVASDVFVFHHGSVSFGDVASEAAREGSARLHERYPGFRRANAAARDRQPLGAVWASLRMGVAAPRVHRPVVLHLLHSPSRFGGTELFVDALIAAQAAHLDAAVLYPSTGGFELCERWLDDRGTQHDRVLHLPNDGALEIAIDLCAPSVVHVQNLIGHPAGVLAQLRSFPGRVVCTVHDLHLVCPHHWLLYRNTVACGVPDDLNVCASCLPETRDLGVDAILDLRADVERGIDAVDEWVFPSWSAYDHFDRVFTLPADRVHVVPHGSVVAGGGTPRPVDEDAVLHQPLRIACVGRGWAKKGVHLAGGLAELLAPDGIDVHHFGEVREQVPPELHLHGPYLNHDLPRLLRRSGIRVVLLPGPYAETFGFVVSEAMIAGLPVIGPRYGAVAERIRATGAGWTIDPLDLTGFAELMRRLDRCRLEVLRATRQAATTDIAPMEVAAVEYSRLYGLATNPTAPPATHDA